jgi:predicted DNA-binding transcriptional regulator
VSKKNVITVYGELALKHGELVIAKIGKELTIQNKNKRKKLKCDRITKGKKAIVDWVFMDDTGITNVTVETTPEALLSFAKKVMKDKKEMKKLGGVYFRHLSPDLTFIIRSKK